MSAFGSFLVTLLRMLFLNPHRFCAAVVRFLLLSCVVLFNGLGANIMHLRNEPGYTLKTMEILERGNPSMALFNSIGTADHAPFPGLLNWFWQSNHDNSYIIHAGPNFTVHFYAKGLAMNGYYTKLVHADDTMNKPGSLMITEKCV